MSIESEMGKWDYSGISMVCYSDPKQESYKKAAEFLGSSVEDWGCATAWVKKYFEDYRGIDGSYHENVDEVVDLVKYTSDVDNILMRQVLETNRNWRLILENVKKSFKKKFCLVIYTPLVKKTRIGPANPAVLRDGTRVKGKTIYEMYFSKEDILEYFPKEKFKVREETIKTKQGYRKEWILYVERN